MDSRRLIVAVALAIFAISVAMVGRGGITPVSAACPATNPNNSACATTSATINGSSVAPEIECKWELPTTAVANSSTLAANDDSPTSGPIDSSTPAPVRGTPCNLSTTINPCYNLKTPTTSATQPWHHMIDVNAINNTSPTAVPPERNVQLWAAVDHCGGIGNVGDVFWDVYQPCPQAVTTGPTCTAGFSQKVQVHYNSSATQEHDLSPTGTTQNGGTATGGGVITAGHPNLAGQTCDSVAAAGNMFSVAVATGQVASTAVSDPTSGFQALCDEGIKGLYSANIQIDKDEPCGEWKVVLTAVATTGATSQMTNYFSVNCNVALVTDFTTVNWGTITPGIASYIAGDLNWGAGGPTVSNVNNSAMDVDIQFSPMTGTTFGKTIDTFDAKFGRSFSTLNTCDPLTSNTLYDLSVPGGCAATGTPTAPYVLCADELGKLDLSIHPVQASGGTLPNDTYTGTVTLTGSFVTGEPAICFGDYHAVTQ